MKKFTLIEILVVVAIIGVLASLLMPSLGKAREKAISVDCQNRLRQIHIAETMWGLDNENLIMPTYNGKIWTGPLSPYLGHEQNGHGPNIGGANKNESINPYMCPKAKPPTHGFLWTKYAYNAYAGRLDPDGNLYPNANYVQRTNISDPSKALMFMDGHWYLFSVAAAYRWNSDGAKYLHNSGDRNTIFVDGHSRANVTLERQIVDPNAPNYHITWAYGNGN